LHQYLILDALIKKRNKIATKEMQWSQNVVRMLERHALEEIWMRKGWSSPSII
jgi:hypothetical protein